MNFFAHATRKLSLDKHSFASASFWFTLILTLGLLVGCQAGPQESRQASDPTPPTKEILKAEERTPGELLVGVGLKNLHLGATRGEVLEKFGPPSETDENEFVPGQSFFLYHSLGLELTFSGETLEVITLHGNDSPWKAYTGATDEGLGIGSSAEDILTLLGPPTETVPQALRYPEVGILFRLDGDYRDDPGSATVESISILPTS